MRSPTLHSLAAFEPPPRLRGVTAAIATSVLTSQLTVPSTLSALQSPDDMRGLLLALAASVAALLLAILVGRTVTRDAGIARR
jgi:hypothetical protein